MKTVIRLVPYIVSAILTTIIIYWVGHFRDSGLIIYIIPGLIFGIATAISMSGEKNFQSRKIWMVVLGATLLHALIFFLTFVTYGLGGFVFAGLGAWLMSLLAFNLLLDRKYGNVLPLWIAGLVSWALVYGLATLEASLAIRFKGFPGAFGVVYVTWQIGIGMIFFLKLQQFDREDESSNNRGELNMEG